MHDHPACALQERLDKYRGNLMALLGKQPFQLVEALDAASLSLLPDGATPAVCGVCAQNGKPHRLKRRGERRIVAYGHCTGSVAVVGVLERHDLVFFRMPAVGPV